MKTINTGLIQGNSVLKLSFDKVQTSQGYKFFVTVIHNESEKATFDMKEDYWGKWKIVPPAPHWINDMELQISEVLKRKIISNNN